MVSRLSYRGRLLLALLTVSVIPVVLMTAAGVFALRMLPVLQPDAEITRIGEATRGLELSFSLDGVKLTPASEGAKQVLLDAVNALLTSDRQARGKTRENFVSGLAAMVIVSAILLLFGTVVIGRWLSRQLAAPLDEVAAWTGRIKRREPLPPPEEDTPGFPELAGLRAALRDMASSLEQGRKAELEAERLRTFGEVARRVAHEMKNPLTPIRFAVSQLRRRASSDTIEPLEVIAAESARLEAMAREFAELGRLPETVVSPVDLRELLEQMLRATVPDTMEREFVSDPGEMVVEAHYDPLRRAFSNIFRNAIEACNGSGRVSVTLRRSGDAILIDIADTGPGIAVEKRELIFEPYFTEKGDGTGLGLAIVKQTIEHHGGTISVLDTPGGGATFRIRLPA